MDNISLTGKKYPEKNIRVGGIQVAIWRNESKEGRKVYSVSIEKRYKKDDEWKSTTKMKSNDIPKMVLALQEAYKYMNLSLNAKEIIEEATQEVYLEGKEQHIRHVEEEDLNE